MNDSLRIVDAGLAARVDARWSARRTRYLTARGNSGKMTETAWGKDLLTGGMLVCPTCGGHFEGLKYPKAADTIAPGIREREPEFPASRSGCGRHVSSRTSRGYAA